MLDRIQQVNQAGKSVVVVSQWTQVLDLVAHYLKKVSIWGSVLVFFGQVTGPLVEPTTVDFEVVEKDLCPVQSPLLDYWKVFES